MVASSVIGWLCLHVMRVSLTMADPDQRSRPWLDDAAAPIEDRVQVQLCGIRRLCETLTGQAAAHVALSTRLFSLS